MRYRCRSTLLVVCKEIIQLRLQNINQCKTAEQQNILQHSSTAREARDWAHVSVGMGKVFCRWISDIGFSMNHLRQRVDATPRTSSTRHGHVRRSLRTFGKVHPACGTASGMPDISAHIEVLATMDCADLGRYKVEDHMQVSVVTAQVIQTTPIYTDQKTSREYNDFCQSHGSLLEQYLTFHSHIDRGRATGFPSLRVKRNRCWLSPRRINLWAAEQRQEWAQGPSQQQVDWGAHRGPSQSLSGLFGLFWGVDRLVIWLKGVG